MAVALLLAAEEVSWIGILVAILGSSAIGAIVGGYMTTRMRGRIEREEAWRARLIEAADEFTGILGAALRNLGGVLPAASRGERLLRSPNGELTPETTRDVDSVAALMDHAEVLLGRLELLFSTESDVYQHGYRTMHRIDKAVALIRGRTTAQKLIEAVLAERESPGLGSSLLNREQFRDIPELELLSARDSPPDDFDPSDDVNVARWGRELHHAAGESAHSYMRAAHTYIEGYRST